MILCGIDSSTTFTAISWFEDGEYKSKALIDTHKTKDAEERIDEMIRYIFRVLDGRKPDVIYQEYAWLKNNAKTSIELATIIGAVRGWAVNNGCRWYKVMPNAWRKKLNIITKAKREQLKQIAIDYVDENLGIKVRRDDEADAICIGLAGVKFEEDKLFKIPLK